MMQKNALKCSVCGIHVKRQKSKKFIFRPLFRLCLRPLQRRTESAFAPLASKQREEALQVVQTHVHRVEGRLARDPPLAVA